jgi:hypothetical protein
VSDIEHELLLSAQELHAELTRVREVARRAVAAAIAAEDRADGHHEAWLDDVAGALEP